MLKDYDYWLYSIVEKDLISHNSFQLIKKFQVLLDRISHIVKLGDIIKRFDNV